MRSDRTISQCFHRVLNFICKLQDTFFARPVPIDEDCTDSRWRWFKGCLGALDGTYIDVRVLNLEKGHYRTRKGHVTVNVLGVCNMNMQFIYVLTGWEGSVADSRVLRDAISRPDGLRVPTGKYYLCDNGYTNGDGFLASYRGVRYHLREWDRGAMRPQNKEELFNLKHSSARNVIERTFWLLKVCWTILRSQSYYPIEIQNRIIMACCLLHNFVRRKMPDDPLELEIPETMESVNDSAGEFISSIETNTVWTNWHNELATSIFSLYFCKPNAFLAEDCSIFGYRMSRVDDEVISTQRRSGAPKDKGCSRRTWTAKEEGALFNGLKSFVASGWKYENRFRNGYLMQLEGHILHVFPNSNIRPNT
ncbi:UNVERIFIED_CONTAM: hypothetical protein Slati_3965100 [Sesamum latifolium]|uniref:DDE Tnp4 domain-containing protein n=1 Tax=Sesamum latifolium TaxID=2727402 RepID=A0AAW2TPL3_9LAMI